MSRSLFARHRRIGMDSNVLIYLLEGTGEQADRAGELLDAVAGGAGEGVLATLAITEVGSGPARMGDEAMVQRYAAELAALEGVRIISLDESIAAEAAIMRGSGALSIADAVHLATAIAAGATAFVTNDRRIRPMPRLDVVYLDELEPDSG